eukprot:Partr_v1_DN25837_c1_g1_i1_m2805
MSQHPAYTTALLCLAGGTMGFVNKKSRASLIAGSVCALLYAGAGYLIAENRDWGHELALGTSILLTLGMGRRAIKGGLKPMPSMVAALGLLNAGYYGMKVFEYRQ